MRPHYTRMQKRRGSSVLVVIATIGVLLAFWGMAYRMTGSLIRVEASRQSRYLRHKQSIHAMTALDRALRWVEVSKPTLAQTYTYWIDLGTLDAPKYFKITYDPIKPGDPDNPDPLATNPWKVTVTPVPSKPHGAPELLEPSGADPSWPPSP